MDGDKFVLIGPAGWQLLGLVAIMAGVAWWLARKPGAPPPMIVIFFQALAWRMFPALSSWREENQRRARDRFVKDYVGGAASHMSSDDEWDEDDPTVDPIVARMVQQGRQPIATTSNAVNSELHRSTELPDDARDIIRFQAKVESLASLYRSGQVSNLAKAIEATFECSRTSKEESTYQRAKRAIDPLIAKPIAPTPIAGRPTSAVFQSDMEEAA